MKRNLPSKQCDQECLFHCTKGKMIFPDCVGRRPKASERIKRNRINNTFFKRFQRAIAEPYKINTEVGLL